MKNPVTVPVYKVVNYLNRYVQSFAAQNGENLGIILMDDVSQITVVRFVMSGRSFFYAKKTELTEISTMYIET